MRKELYRIWITYAHGVLGCNNSFMSLHVGRIEIPACVRKYIIDLCPEGDLKHVYTHFTDARKMIQITSTLIIPITRAGFDKF
ncbi:hypothetical protein L596_006855 [Steinernema carpocapsae]|uniref:Uncharacterized protein n=1 Tax=Steinernema carpocapsae TaxID=34508 RepID=A0A4U5P8F3_STECR|nr:hypothetical protein L596_006855 [Steinernema carpocapsae]